MRVAAYGTWPSPLSATRVLQAALRFDHLVVDGDDLYWSEGRASEGGRSVIVRRTPDGRVADITPAGFNVRSRVHEYGGAAYTVHGGTVCFCNFADQRIYRQRPGEAPAPVTAAGYFYADARVDAARNRLVCVREDHTAAADEPANTIVAVPLDGGGDRVLVEGADFYADPVLSPDAARLAWIEWRHPNMPWDGTELWVAELSADGAIGTRRRIAGGPEESIFQPEWSPDGRLCFVSDRTSWWNLYRQDADGGVEALCSMEAEFGKPQWTFSQITYAFVSANEIAASYTEAGRWKLALLTLEPRAFTPIALSHEPVEGLRATPHAVFFIGGSPAEPLAIVTTPAAALRSSERAIELAIVRSSKPARLDAAWVSAARAITFASDGRDVHGFYYAPASPEAAAPPGERPPLLVLSHGGPTGASLDVFDEAIQFWTTRGFAVLDVNYSGSTGYGRAYRDRLKGEWGLMDVADCVNGARHLVAQGQADPDRLVIRGGSAGGYTTLAALTFYDVFKAGASYYGISDVEVLARDTHKFESRYLDSLIGPYPAARDEYRRRSPIHFTERLSSALILFQGLEDRVVPPNQSAMMADAVRRRGLPVAYVAFEGEQHGFRKAENLIRCLEAELYFYGAIFGFRPADRIAPVPIDNLR